MGELMNALIKLEVRSERDVVSARQRARQLAGLLAFDVHDQTRIATAVSEISRNALEYAGGGRVCFSVDSGEPAALVITVADEGQGIQNLDAIYDGSYQSPTGMGVGLMGARKLMDGFVIDTENGRGTRVELRKWLAQSHPPIGPELYRRISVELTRERDDDLLGEVRRQNQELVRALQEQKDGENALRLLNTELEETNRGVMVLYAELEEKAEALSKSNELKSRFFSEMNHEVRTPINAILNLSEILLNGSLGAPTAAQAKPLTFIRKCAQQLSELVNDLLDLTRAEAGKMVVRASSFTVNELFAGLRGVFRPVHTNERIALVFEEFEGLPPLHTDEGKLAQILRNFVSNALKFTYEGSVRVQARVQGDDMVFSVSDTGIGIELEEQRRLFQPFVQLENSVQRQHRGSGLGLSLSLRLAELLGGTLRLTSAPSVGSTFEAVIPRQYTGPRKSDEMPLVEASPSDRPRVLIVDDDEVARYLLRRALGDLRANIVEVATGESAIREARARPPHLMFLDLAMPDVDGFAVIEALQAHATTREIPVVVHTATVLDAAQRERLAARTLAISSKGASAHETEALFQSVLRRARLFDGADGANR